MAEDDLRIWTEHEESRVEDETTERHLGALLRRCDAPEGFTDRVMARVAATAAAEARRSAVKPQRRGLLLQFTQPAWRAAYAAAAVLALTAGAVHVQHARTEQRRADEASAQFDTALQVTDHALDHVSAKLETTEFGQVQRALEANGGGRQ